MSPSSASCWSAPPTSPSPTDLAAAAKDLGIKYFLISYTDLFGTQRAKLVPAAAIKGMSANPEDRSEAVAELFAAAGARLISWYLTLGPYDWLIIAEAPDEPTMISAVLAAAAGGSLSDITTTVALTASDTAKAFQRAGELTLKFRSAGWADYYGVGIDSGPEIGEA